MKRHLFIVIVVVSLICGCGGGEQAANTPGPPQVTSATQTSEAVVLPAETPAPTETAVPPIPPTVPPSRQPAATAGSTSTWIRAFEGPDYGAFSDVVLAEDGSILAVGATNFLHFPPYSGDALFVKLTVEGDLLWERTWGGEGYEHAWSVATAGDGGFYVFGETDSYGAGGRDFFLLKIAEDGTENWFRTYGGSGREWPFGMLPLSNGDLLIYGYTESEGSGENQYAIRVQPDGDPIWEYIAESPGDELVIDAIETGEGDLVLAVVTGEDGGLVRLDAGGSVQWSTRYELDGWQFASQIAPVDEEGFLLAGFEMSSDTQMRADTWLARCTTTGELEWETTFGDPSSDDYAQSLIQLDDGTYLMGGIGKGMPLSRIDRDGNILWGRSLVGEDAVYSAEALVELPDGGYLVAGFIQITNGRSYDAILLRTDAEGWVGEERLPD